MLLNDLLHFLMLEFIIFTNLNEWEEWGLFLLENLPYNHFFYVLFQVESFFFDFLIHFLFYFFVFLFCYYFLFLWNGWLGRSADRRKWITFCQFLLFWRFTPLFRQRRCWFYWQKLWGNLEWFFYTLNLIFCHELWLN